MNNDPNKLDMDALDCVAGAGNAINAINQAVDQIKDRPGDTINAPYGGGNPIQAIKNPGAGNASVDGPINFGF